MISFNLNLQCRSSYFYHLWEKWALGRFNQTLRVTKLRGAQASTSYITLPSFSQTKRHLFIFYSIQVHWNKLAYWLIPSKRMFGEWNMLYWAIQPSYSKNKVYLCFLNKNWELTCRKPETFGSGFSWQHVTNDFTFVIWDFWDLTRTSSGNYKIQFERTVQSN